MDVWDTPEPLFDAPPPVERTLSQRYSTTEYRSTHTQWIKTSSNNPCDECFATQHEASGQGWPRNPARTIRRIPKGPELRLCSAHQALWKIRDGDYT